MKLYELGVIPELTDINLKSGELNSTLSFNSSKYSLYTNLFNLSLNWFFISSRTN